MLNKKIIGLLVLLLIVPSSWASDLKIGVLNMQKLQNEAPQIKDIMSRMQKHFEVPGQALSKLANEIQQDEKDLKQNEVLMSPAKLKQTRQALVEKVKSFREQEADLNKEMQTMRNQELAVFNNKVNQMLEALAKKEKFDLILAEGIVFVSDKLDITDKLLSQLKKDN
ncbi:MAG: OmpH family outer membrane protein [Gammaproteobacteria bacterium]|nr:OmpH family outer membrane protein [Gammaproteobacteria bacterium]